MKYDVIYFSKHNMSTARSAAEKSNADQLLFVHEGSTVADGAVSNLEKYVSADERYEYIYGQYERLLLGYKWGRDARANAEFEQTIKGPRHFDGVRKELAKLYAQHFLKVTSLKKFRKTQLFNPLVCDFSDKFGALCGKENLPETAEQPLVSVVIRTHRRNEVLRHTLKCLRNEVY